MRKNYFFLGILFAFVSLFTKADEGMWLLQLMQEQHSYDLMKKSGLKMDAIQLYNPSGVSLKDAVGIFGGGCTGEIISDKGLILTNHHCGYASIQAHSSVEHDYLTDGFWSKSFSEELPTKNLQFTFIERIVDVTDIINEKIQKKEITEIKSFTRPYLAKLAQDLYQKSDLKGKKGIVPMILPFYAGNKFYMFYKKVYSDVRMVAAPPSSVGKFGGETDNWMWPRHTGDFSIFRIYADKNGEPAEYSKDNVPLKTKKHLSINIKGLSEGDYAMVMGFPGSTNRYLTASEVKDRMESTNEPRIKIRGARQDVLRAEMNKSDKVRIQYASKFARSSNYWKNSIGMNKAIIDNNVLGTKAEIEKKFMEFAKKQNNADYMSVVGKINKNVEALSSARYQYTCLSEIVSAIEFEADYRVFDSLKEALDKKDKKQIETLKKDLSGMYDRIHNKDYDHEVDRKVAKALLPLYTEMVAKEDLPSFFKIIDKKFKGDYDKYVDYIYDNSILANKANLEKFLKKPSKKALRKELLPAQTRSFIDLYQKLGTSQTKLSKDMALLHKTYIRGLGEMKAPFPSYPDANFTLRLTYGNVKAYEPRDGVHYKYYTTANGILEKEDPNNREFNVPAKLKQLILNKDFGRYALPDGNLPVCFLTTNDITGGNSGSPVINGNGELIGCAFDGNWESLSGDINFDNKLQRCICLDIRYMLFIVEKLGNCKRLVDEMTIIE